MKTMWLVAFLFPILLFAGERPADYEKRVSESELRAIALYPDAGVERSRLWTAISEEIARLEKSDPSILDDPSYPLKLAAKVAANLGIAPVSTSSTGQEVPPPTVPSAEAERKRLEEFELKAIRNPKEALAEALRMAVEEYPELGMEGTEFNFLFVAAYKSTTQASLLRRPDYPILLARKIGLEIKQRQQAAAAAASSPKLAPLDQWTNVDPMMATPIHSSVARKIQPAGPTQRNGRPLPRNWIDPDQADANFHAQQLQHSIDRNTRSLQMLENEVSKRRLSR